MEIFHPCIPRTGFFLIQIAVRNLTYPYSRRFFIPVFFCSSFSGGRKINGFIVRHSAEVVRQFGIYIRAPKRIGVKSCRVCIFSHSQSTRERKVVVVYTGGGTVAEEAFYFAEARFNILPGMIPALQLAVAGSNGELIVVIVGLYAFQHIAVLIAVRIAHGVAVDATDLYA